MSIGGEHIQAGTGRRLTYWAAFAPTRRSPSQIVFIAQIREGGRLIGAVDSDLLIDGRRLTAEEALRFHIKRYIDRTKLKAGIVGPLPIAAIAEARIDLSWLQ